MDANPGSLIHDVAQNYLICLADFPSVLEPTQLDSLACEQASIYAGLSALHTIIGKIYEHFSLLVTGYTALGGSEILLSGN